MATVACIEAGADPGGVQGVRTPALVIRVPFSEKNSVNKYHRECIKLTILIL